jgi:DNA repair ATPase RecN
MNNLEQIESDISLIQGILSEKGNTVRKWLAINESIEERSSSIVSKLHELKDDIEAYDKAKTLHGVIMAEARSANKKDIVDCVAGIVKNFYGDEYQFDVEFSDDGALEFIVRENVDGKTKTYYVSGDDSVGLGGGLSDTISTGLRIMLLLKSGSAGPLFLDEAYRQLDAERASKVGFFLSSICEEYGVQIVMSTHLMQVADEADMKINIVKTGGRSVVSCEEQ